MSNFKMDDYVPVNERIEAFYAAHPSGSLQSEIVELTPDRVTVKASAYRTPDDALPGIGHSSLEIPGSTPFTRGSEIENAETSAWGRAIAALGFEVKRGLASAEEVRNKQPERSRGPAQAGSTPSGSAPVRSPEEQALIGQLLEVPLMTVARMSLLADAVGVKKGERATADQLREMLVRAEQPGAGVPPAPAASVPAADTGAPVASGGEAGSSEPASPTTRSSEPSIPPASATAQPEDDAVPPGAYPSAAPAPSDEAILEAAGPGAEIVWPKPGTKAYRDLPSGTERSKAKAWWDAHKDEPVQESLAAALGNPVADA